MVDAVLSIEMRNRQTPTGPRQFVVPRLAVRTSVDELSAGTVAPALDWDRPLEIEVTTSGLMVKGEQHAAHFEVLEAEVVTPELLELEARIRADGEQFGLDPETYLAAVRAQAQGREEQMRKCSDQVRAGTRVPLGFANNRVQWRTT
jgi:hypothetical protein